MMLVSFQYAAYRVLVYGESLKAQGQGGWRRGTHTVGQK